MNTRHVRNATRLLRDHYAEWLRLIGTNKHYQIDRAMGAAASAHKRLATMHMLVAPRPGGAVITNALVDIVHVTAPDELIMDGSDEHFGPRYPRLGRGIRLLLDAPEPNDDLTLEFGDDEFSPDDVCHALLAQASDDAVQFIVALSRRHSSGQ